MFKFLQKNLFYKAFVMAAIITVLSATVFYILYHSGILQNITPLYFTLVLIDVAVIYLILIHYFITNPFRIILKEIKALLTGRRYNKIYTERIDELGVIAHFFNEITKSLERASKDIQDRRRMSQELDIASKLQKQTLPQIVPEIPSLSIIAKWKPAQEIGGDCFDFLTVSENTYFFIADVTGHGVPSGLVMTMGHTLTMTFANMYPTGYQVLVEVNRYLKPLINSVMFMTMTLFRWNNEEKKLYAIGAGHEHIIIYKSKGKNCLIEKSGGIALGMVSNNAKIVSEIPLSFEPGDILVLYTDGVTDTRNVYGELFGLSRLITVIEETCASNVSIENLYAKINQELISFGENHIQEDDMSLIICKYGNEQFASSETKSTIWK